MKLGVLSDSHDNIWALDEAMEHLASADAVIHCGDLIAPFVITRLAKLSCPVHVVWGNNDGDHVHLQAFADQHAHVTIHGDTAELKLAGRRIAANHYPKTAAELAANGGYDLVCYGHDHTAHESRVGGTLLLNPGEVMGLNGRRTIAFVDLETMAVEWVELS